MKPQLIFRIAHEPWEFEQIHRLNYRTFVEEIPQHPPGPERRLVDKFHAENTYAIGLAGERVVGMVAACGKRPFSLDQKLANLDSYLPSGRTPVEIRLLSVEPEYRNSHVFCGLVGLISQLSQERGFDLGVLSGTLRQLKLYQHLGCVPFGPLVGSADAQYQPMYLSWETFQQKSRPFTRIASKCSSGVPLSFLPGPVDVHPEVRRAFESPPKSHRVTSFVAEMAQVRRLLCRLTKARDAVVLLGSGTLANDAVAGQLSLLRTPGVVLANGEFGERLADHARRFGLAFTVLSRAWGESFPTNEIRSALARLPAGGWVWAVHCETSTGVMNDLELLRNLSRQQGLKLCLDCISSLGTVPVDLPHVHLATATSNKGVGAYPGLAFVFFNQAVAPAPDDLPRYLDLGLYAETTATPFTHSSNLLAAARQALDLWLGDSTRFAAAARLGRELRAELRQLGFQLIGEGAPVSPAVITIALPDGMGSEQFGRQLEEAGLALSYRSAYLLRRNWVQICLMGQCAPGKVQSLLEALTARFPCSFHRRK